MVDTHVTIQFALRYPQIRISQHAVKARRAERALIDRKLKFYRCDYLYLKVFSSRPSKEKVSSKRTKFS
jgi:hypothetical protein